MNLSVVKQTSTGELFFHSVECFAICVEEETDCRLCPLWAISSRDGGLTIP